MKSLLDISTKEQKTSGKKSQRENLREFNALNATETLFSTTQEMSFVHIVKLAQVSAVANKMIEKSTARVVNRLEMVDASVVQKCIGDLRMLFAQRVKIMVM